ncbi:uncharacterized protein F4807DRAFT_462130 [Annulohypoxylon truncatum]|uniref:uncharacterized protein n=1 Tax=Annulohypoxylon truncatum TaxID=327061 RepID=UPI002007A816|nr:uncharacterized protein F4807DRAFT_462130 [Annulohypoxylon truncatum]KAI1208041.1 hypothetical protein F4807DRAFT_462130 [Annulohypoxylon truncatum]
MAEPVFDLNDNLFGQDPALIIRSVVAYPDRYFTPEFDIAQRDGVRQLAHRQNLAASGPFPVPLLNTAIESEDTDEWLLHRFMEGLDAPFPGAVNAVYPILQMLEPPLHTAVRAGRADAVRMLLGHPTINTMTVYVQQRSANAGDCRLSGFAHPSPCEPDSFESPCLTASEYVIECFSRAEAGSMLQRNIENCGLVFVAAGSFPGPLDADSRVVPSFARAMQAGMHRYTLAILERILKSAPAHDEHRVRLLQRGLERILYQAAGAMESNPFIQQILDLSDENNIFPLPANPSSLGVNPIAAALENTHPHNAHNILDFIKRRLGAEFGLQSVEWVRVLLRNSDIMSHSSNTDDNHVFFRALIDFIPRPPLLGPGANMLKQQFEQERNEFMTQCAHEAFRAGKLAILNATLLIEGQGCDTDLWLRAAIEYRNTGAFEVIISKWLKMGKSLDTPLSAVPASENLQGAQEGWTILGAVIEARLLVAIELLLNAGADPNVVVLADWFSLYNEIDEAQRVLQMPQFVKIYFGYGFFQGDTLLVSQEELDNNQAIREHTRLILRIAELHGGIMRVGPAM